MAAVLDDKTLRLVRVFNAPRERVFDAWTHEDQFIQWMCPPNVHVDEVRLDDVYEFPSITQLSNRVEQLLA